ncbi:enoyl-CoA hydratase/isomerase family protein [Anaerobacillus alkaliphilus]|uniref:Ethylmalonyl-CoA decarboxylase n=1 Tax=Anaerobacillus alkaliphilus TaxID=1548597 RepID=A0A4Q0VQD0_9BACI|nr:enoyl-CoA hydratase/isomerase family protein [Anaerobacillus alkaliphilus]RXI98117.1 enoyl-CoA hydratase/isomerase family protein [Anaerobacillus alkaliphilus]
MGKVTLKIQNHQAWLSINRPEKRNAIDYEVIELLNEQLDIIGENNEVKVLVVTGVGEQAFCSGGDLSVFHSIHTKQEAKEMLVKMAEVLHKLFFFPKPTIAFLNGSAVGGGCEIATACDFRIAEKNVKLGFIQGKLGITTGWGGSTYLVERVSNQDAFWMLLSAEIFDAKEGLNRGFIQNMFTREEFDYWLMTYTKQPLGVIKAYKQRILAQYNQNVMLERVLAEIEDCSTLWETPEHHEAVQQFLQK